MPRPTSSPPPAGPHPPARPPSPLAELAEILQAPDAARAMYRHLCRAVREAGVVGHDDAVQALALAAVAHLRGRGGQRVTLVGPSGCGKTRLATTVLEQLARLGAPTLSVTLSQVSQSSWQGLTWASDIIPRLYAASGGDLAAMNAAACVHLDELCKLAVPPNASPSTRDYSLGKQADLMQLLQNGGVGMWFRADGEGGPTLAWQSDGAFVISTMACAGLAHGGRVGPSDLVAYGFRPELVGRLGHVLTLRASGAPELRRVLAGAIAPLVAQCADYGYALEVPPETLAWVARAAAADASGTGARLGAAWLAAAAQRVLARLLDADAPAGTRHVLSPDDVGQLGAKQSAPPRDEEAEGPGWGGPRDAGSAG